VKKPSHGALSWCDLSGFRFTDGENGAGKTRVARFDSAEIRILNLAVNAEWNPVARLQQRR